MDECNKAFNNLKDALTFDPVLEYAETWKQLILDTVASHGSIGAVLSQKIDGHQIACHRLFSKCLSRPERNYLL
ncbi:hypothetical protein TNCT_485191 [Trichonephila clavata]|uniref:Reverse transcriptase/retrotransposon-derived protein RNase H-like domain-containing protein n=1 Tax=Trichonephila clavata TaxID=2740835 RepID=A0A8X6FH04_TRICU|nr:hypothetical protein TNCT_485191 [Trichonephila clavata]